MNSGKEKTNPGCCLLDTHLDRIVGNWVRIREVFFWLLLWVKWRTVSLAQHNTVLSTVRWITDAAFFQLGWGRVPKGSGWVSKDKIGWEPSWAAVSWEAEPCSSSGRRANRYWAGASGARAGALQQRRERLGRTQRTLFQDRYPGLHHTNIHIHAYSGSGAYKSKGGGCR